MVNKTNKFLFRKPFTLVLLMELILSFMLLALLSMALRKRLLRSTLSGRGGFSVSSFRKRLALVGGFSFIISSSTWSRRQVSCETKKKNFYYLLNVKFLSRVVSGGTALRHSQNIHTHRMLFNGVKKNITNIQKIENRMKRLLLCERLKHLFRITNQNL